VQAYAVQAATLGADLLDAFGRPGADARRRWAADLAERFRARFWVDGYPAIALDGTGKPVDGLVSNVGHLLGTGLLTAAEEEHVAQRLAELDSGWGLWTLTPRAAGFDPLSYHLGSVWPHDTAIAMLGLVRSGHNEEAARLARGLIGAACAVPAGLPPAGVERGGVARARHRPARARRGRARWPGVAVAVARLRPATDRGRTDRPGRPVGRGRRGRRGHVGRDGARRDGDGRIARSAGGAAAAARCSGTCAERAENSIRARHAACSYALNIPSRRPRRRMSRRAIWSGSVIGGGSDTAAGCSRCSGGARWPCPSRYSPHC